MIAEILVDVVKSSSMTVQSTKGSSGHVRSCPEFVNGMSFAINGNISLRCVDLSPRIVSFRSSYVQDMQWGGLHASEMALLGVVGHEVNEG